jgi:hypothetical protein
MAIFLVFIGVGAAMLDGAALLMGSVHARQVT